IVASGRGLPNFSRATPPISFSSSSRSWPKPLATSSSTQMAWDVTSGPIPSPGREVTRSSMESSLSFPKSILRGRALRELTLGFFTFCLHLRRWLAAPLLNTLELNTPELDTPKIIFLLAVMLVGEGDRHRRLAGAARYVRVMRVIGIGRIGCSSDGTQERQ